MPVTAVRRPGGVARILIDHPPVNALSVAARRGLIDAIRTADADPAVTAMVVAGVGRTFSAGADLGEFDKPREEPGWRALIEVIEAASKPIVAALHGPVLGGGLELALACHHRVAKAGARFALPEVELGLIPASGGTQRLPRIAGVATALEMIARGRSLDAQEALAAGVVEAVFAGDDWLDEADRFAAACLVVRTRDRVVEGAEAIGPFRARHAALLADSAAARAAVDAIEAAATLDFDASLAREEALYLALKGSDEARARLYLNRAERAATRIPPGTVQAIERVAVIGAGTMGAGIAMCFLDAGLPVTLVETSEDALTRGTQRIDKLYAAQVTKGRRSPGAMQASLALLTPTLDIEKVTEADLVVEAVFEDLAVKTELFARLDRIARPGAILASNTSFLDLDAIAAATTRPEAVVGLHFFSPANVMRLLEVVRRDDTPADTIATLMALGKRIGKLPVLVGACFGFVGNRMVAHRQAQANAMLLEGAMPWDIDRALRDFGFAMGPFQMSDLVGLDLGWKRGAPATTPRARLCEAGRLGQKNGAGFYDYDEQRTPRPSPEVEALLAAFVAEQGGTPRRIAAAEILDRCLLPIINEGARILEEGIAQRASDIDVVWATGYGWPKRHGGPLYYADTLGLSNVVARLRKLAPAHGAPFEPAPLLVRLAAAGERLSDHVAPARQ